MFVCYRNERQVGNVWTVTSKQRNARLWFLTRPVFPIINGEKGILSLHYDIPGGAAEGDYQLLSFVRENMVPQDAHAEVTVQMQKN